MTFANACASRLLQSPFHRLLSGSTDLIRYDGRRTGREITIPTQYVERGDDIVILVGRSDCKTWWKNFRSERDVELLVRGRWLPMRARAVIGAVGPADIGPLLDAYVARFPRSLKVVGDGADGRRPAKAAAAKQAGATSTRATRSPPVS